MDRKTLTEFLALTVLILAAWGVFYHFTYGGKQPPAPRRPSSPPHRHRRSSRPRRRNRA